MPNYTRYAQAQAMKDAGFIGMVEASVMKVAWDVLQDTENADFVQRSGLSRALLGGDAPRATIESYIRRFGWFAVNVPAVQAQAYAKTVKNPNGLFFPEQISDEALDAAVASFWNTVASVKPIEIDPPIAEPIQIFAGPIPVQDAPIVSEPVAATTTQSTTNNTTAKTR